MSDSPNSTATPPNPGPARPPFPVVRLVYALGYGLLAWFVMHILFVLAAVQFVMIAVNGRVHDELKAFSGSLLQYEWELIAFITFIRDEQPFPVGPFPKQA